MVKTLSAKDSLENWVQSVKTNFVGMVPKQIYVKEFSRVLDLWLLLHGDILVIHSFSEFSTPS